MITEDYVSFEIAKLLKEKGFNEKLLTFYLTDEAKKEGCFQIMAFTDDEIDNNHSNHCYLAPTLQMAMKWLREVHKIFIEISISIDLNGEYHYRYSILNKECKYVRKGYIDFDWNYEQACEAAIKYCLENLI